MKKVQLLDALFAQIFTLVLFGLNKYTYFNEIINVIIFFLILIFFV